MQCPIHIGMALLRLSCKRDCLQRYQLQFPWWYAFWIGWNLENIYPGHSRPCPGLECYNAIHSCA